MKRVLLLFSLIASIQISEAQVGINTTDPKAQLDISAGMTPSEMDGLLIPRLDEFPVGVGADQNGMLIFVTGDGAPTKGFYYWDQGGPAWVPFQESASSDSDWFVANTTTSSNNINDNIYTLGGVSIGTNATASNSTLYLATDLANSYGIYTETENGTTESMVAINNVSTLDGTGEYRAISNSLGGTTSGNNIAITNTITNDGTGLKTAVLNSISSDFGERIGLQNSFFAGSGNATGLYNIISNGTQDGIIHGVRNTITAAGNGRRYGIRNDISGTGTGIKYGTYNRIGNTSGGIHYGVYSDAQNATGYAGYFLGRTSLGNTTANRYVMPANDGTAGQVMTTDGTGQISFASPTAISGSLDEAYDFSGAGLGRTITADTGAVNIVGTDGLRVEGNIQAAERIIHDGDTNTFLAFSTDRVEVDAGGINYINIENTNSTITINEDSNPINFRVESNNENNMLYVDGTNNTIGIGENNPNNPIDIGIETPFDLAVNNTGQDAIFIIGNNATGQDAVGGSISFGGAHPARKNSRRAAISSTQTGADEDNVGLSFYVHTGPINTAPMVEGMRLTHNRRLGINNTDPSANLDVIGTLQYEDGNESVGYVLASDATGNATWTDPSTLTTGVEKINDLTDGKSDNDGSEDGSSIYLGIGSGSSDDLTDNRNVGIGFESLANNVDGFYNTAIGYNSLNANQDGESNTAIGASVLSANVDGHFNTAVGRGAAAGNVNGSSNVALGVNAYQSNTDGSFNTVIGVDAATALTASSNTIIGRRAMNSYTAGGENVAIGVGAGYYGSGIQNTFIGTSAGNNLGTGERNGSVFLGYGAGTPETTSNKLYIENSASATPLIYGEFDNDIARVNGELQVGDPTGTGYALPTNQGTAAQVLTSNGDGTTAWAAGGATMAQVMANPKHPDGFTGFESLTHQLGTTDYTVPAGKNLYITMYTPLGATNLQLNGVIIAVSSNNSGYSKIVNPIIAGAGDVVSISNANGIINGYVVDASVAPITQDITITPYTVPVNKNMVILSVSSDTALNTNTAIYTINGEIIYVGKGNAYGNNTSSFYGPIFLSEGDIFSASNNASFNGYLVDN